MTKFTNIDLLLKLYEKFDNAGIDWRFERRQCGKHLLSKALVRNMTGEESHVQVSIYIDFDTNAIFPVIVCDANDKFKHLIEKLDDMNDVQELDEDEYGELGEKYGQKHKIYKFDNVYKVENAGTTGEWFDNVVDLTKKLLKTLQLVVY